MRLTKCVSVLSAAALIAGCSAYSSKPTTTILPSSNKSIDIVLHRGDVRMMDCATLAVLQTYAATGQLIDSKEARGTALHCAVIPALIDAGGRVGAATVTRPAITKITTAVSNGISNAVSNTVSNTNAQAQGQGQSQAQLQGQSQGQSQGQTSSNVWQGGNVHNEGHSSGNNGYGNGGDDGSPNGHSDDGR